MRALLVATFLTLAAPAAALADIPGPDGVYRPTRPPGPPTEPVRPAGCGRRAGGTASDRIALVFAFGFAALFLAGHRRRTAANGQRVCGRSG